MLDLPADEPGLVEGAGTTVRAVDRAVAILRCFSVRSPSMSVAQIQAAVGLSRPTVYRLLETLEGTGLIRSEGNPQRFRLAHGVMQLAHVWLAGLNLPELARPMVEALRDQTGETAAFFVPRGDMRLCVLEYRSHEVLAVSRGIGDMGRLTDGASGKAMLAFMSDVRQRQLLDSLEDAVTRKRLGGELAQTRRSGFSVSRGEVFAGAAAVASPVLDQSGAVAGSLGVFGPQSRMDAARVEEAAGHVLATSRRLATLLGYSSEGPAFSASKPGSRR